MTAVNIQACALCGGLTRKHASTLPGYREHEANDSYECTNCGAVRADVDVDESLYDQIYAVQGDIPTYQRYATWADAIASQRDPLAYLTNQSEIFWSVAERVRSAPPKNVLEIGCGLGYLTYALRKRGINARGIDLSATAIAEAKRRFGDHYAVATIAETAAVGERFDLVIMTEVIEHVEDPIALVRDALGLVTSGGALFITTPNRDYYPPTAIWQTEPAPVHLWWFSERSVLELAKRAGGVAALTDFSVYDREHPDLYTAKLDVTAPRGPILSREGTVVRSYGLDFAGPPILLRAITELRRRNLHLLVYRVLSKLASIAPGRRISRRRETIAAAIIHA